MKIKFWGTRGSIPVPGEETLRYGGNTPCIEVIAAGSPGLILDAGTGIRGLGDCLEAGPKVEELHLLISHTHWDHIQGIPFFAPLYRPDFRLMIYVNNLQGLMPRQIIDRQMDSFFFPVDASVLKAEIDFRECVENSVFFVGDLKVETIGTNHSKGTLAFKISDRGRSLVYMTDNEILFEGEGEAMKSSISSLNSRLVEFCRGCDYLIHDSMYSSEGFESKKGWGHSNNITLAFFSICAQVKNLILFHFDPQMNDKMIEMMEKQTKEIFIINNSGVNCRAAFEGLEIDI
ncbi:MAG: MBL fold metallo-hydrolase [Methanococcaceae archaeon]